VVAYSEGGDGPDPSSLMFGMSLSVDEPWNIKCIDILLEKLHTIDQRFRTVVDRQSDAYWRDLISKRFNRLRTEWRKSQMIEGETEKDWNERMEKMTLAELKQKRQRARRLAVRLHFDAGNLTD